MGRILVITGDSRGIGYAIAKKFYENGWRVIGISRSEKQLPWEHLVGDISKLETWERVASYLKEKNLEVNAFIHNAGIHEKTPFEKLTFEQFEKTIRVNFFLCFLRSKVSLSLYSEK